MSETNPQAFSYLPHTDSDRQEMLKAIGVRTFEELLGHIPAKLRAGELKLAAGLPELEVRERITALAAKNTPASSQATFLGGGFYRRYVPAALPSIVGRSEFATAYTPYQPEVSQGTLQAIYEFQTAVCLLTDMEVANASMYDGPTACAEAALMAARLTGRNRIVISESVNPEYRMVTATYAGACRLAVDQLGAREGTTAKEALDFDTVAAVVVQHPNYFGCLEDLVPIERAIHKAGGLLIVITEPISLGLIKPPGQLGADIVVGDAQPCGNCLSFGGPSAGYMATRHKFVRQLPGRLAGVTVDNRGQRAFTLTLQTREQHIRRAKATSNICTNQALNALTMLVYLTLLGPQGLRELSQLSVERAHYLAERLAAVPGASLAFAKPFFNEFVLKTQRPAAQVLDALACSGILGGIDISAQYPWLGEAILVCVTELNPPAELDLYVKALPQAIAETKSTGSLLTASRPAKA